MVMVGREKASLCSLPCSETAVSPTDFVAYPLGLSTSYVPLYRHSTISCLHTQCRSFPHVGMAHARLRHGAIWNQPSRITTGRLSHCQCGREIKASAFHLQACVDDSQTPWAVATLRQYRLLSHRVRSFDKNHPVQVRLQRNVLPRETTAFPRRKEKIAALQGWNLQGYQSPIIIQQARELRSAWQHFRLSCDAVPDSLHKFAHYSF